MVLPHQQHLLRFRKLSGAQLIEVNPAWKIACIKSQFMIARRLALVVQQRGDFLLGKVKDFEGQFVFRRQCEGNLG